MPSLANRQAASRYQSLCSAPGLQTLTVLAVLCILVFSSGVSAQQTTTAETHVYEPTRWFSFSFDNDIFAGTDGGYTNGIYLSWASAWSKTDYDAVPKRWHHRLQSRLLDIDSAERVMTTHNIGQSMITPDDITLNPPDPNDVPYAGLLYWQGSTLALKGSRAEFANLLLGIAGPASLAEESQKIVHGATGSEDPQGWDFQLRNEPLFALQYGRYWRAAATDSGFFETDLVTGYQLGIGNFQSAADVAGYLRIGKKLQNSYVTMLFSSNRELNPISHSNGWFAYVGASLQYQANMIALDGNSFRNGPSVEYDNLQNRYLAGLAFSGQRWGFSFNFVDFGGLQNSIVRRQRFGSFSLLWRLQ